MAKHTGHHKPVLQLDKPTKRIMALMGNSDRAREYKKLMLVAIQSEKNFRERKVIDRSESADK